MSPKTLNLFLFHRDLRLEDNTALIALAKQSVADGVPVLPVFVFTPEQIDPKKNDYFSHPAVQFMCESLDDLAEQLKAAGGFLYTFRGDTLGVVQSLVKSAGVAGWRIGTVGWNEDYSVYATQRDQRLRDWCESKDIACLTAEDYGLVPLRVGLLPDGRAYRVLSQFYKKLLGMTPSPFRAPDGYVFSKNTNKSIFPTRAPFAFGGDLAGMVVKPADYHAYYTPLDGLAMHGGRERGRAILARIRRGELKDYAARRDFPAQPGTTRASPHLRFGTISIRELFQVIRDTPGYGLHHPLIRELVFRDFYLKIYALTPKLQRGQALLAALDKAVPWSYNKTLFQAWTTGTTGFPLVDAGMRELNTTGFQHNRIRMLTSSVLTKYFLIDWRWGMKYFYQHLVDADGFSNTAGWGWSSSTGADAVPYFRAPFNPFLQSQKFDKDGDYIKTWVPELKAVAAADLHRWGDAAIRAKYPGISYPAPVVEQKEASARAMKVFKEAAAAAKGA